MTIEYFINFYNKYNFEILFIVLLMLSIIPAVFFIKKAIFTIIKGYISKWCGEYEIIVQKYNVYTYLLHTLLSLYFIFWSNIIDSFAHPYVSSTPHLISGLKNNIIGIYTGISFTLLTLAGIDTTFDIYQKKKAVPLVRRAPLSLCVQVLKMIIIGIASILIIAHILNISPRAFFASLGAAAALLTFLFKDSVVGLVASLQIISYDIIRIGDYIRIAQLNIEGTVEKITIAITKIRNTDQSISTIPTSSLLTTNVVNSRGMKEVAAQKIQRAIYLDMNSIVFVPATFLEELKSAPYLMKKAIEQVNIQDEKNSVTNIKIFRLYITEYLKSHSAIYQQGFTFLVRQLAPTTSGLPLELYVFTTEMDLNMYENIQADIFDHLLAVLPQFQLKTFQK
ncbi:mechanosensitive ion channel domain-containing protein [Candidatus Tisiphia endosymbiont of Beris chalybata]|uniref:mechanosensitive ion channel domain-containing protein n=1 Tax=Candidatus Tisiphia endosymbiont of Beris chalybata TaxID=3066262 RepID=UPI00312CA885